MVDELLAARHLPPFLPKAEMLAVLLREEYGFLPPSPTELTFTVAEEDAAAFDDLAIRREMLAHCTVQGQVFSFPFRVVLPKGDGPHPMIELVNYGDHDPDFPIPHELILDAGFACLSFNYEDISTDDGDMTNGLAGMLYPNGRRQPTDAGKIAMWAWAAHRVMDYAQTVSQLDTAKSVMCGHSRLGKTALLAVATDERFAMAYSNESGCGGAALFRETVGESIGFITDTFPFWFCENFKRYKHRDDAMPFNQHYLTACIAPRRVYIASAEEDQWADPESEFLNCVAVSRVYEQAGLVGFVYDDQLPKATAIYHWGNVAYHIRPGRHRFTPEDWQYMLAYAQGAFKVAT